MYNLKALRLWLVTLCRVRPTISQTFLFVIGQHSALAANTALLPILEAEIFCLQNVNGSMNILLKIYLQVWPSALLHHFIALKWSVWNLFWKHSFPCKVIIINAPNPECWLQRSDKQRPSHNILTILFSSQRRHSQSSGIGTGFPHYFQKTWL